MSEEMAAETARLKKLARELNLDIGHPEQMSVSLDAVQKIPMHMAQKYRILGVMSEGEFLTVLTDDPFNYYGLEDVRQTTGMNLIVRLCTRKELDRSIGYYYAELSARAAATKANGIQKPRVETLEMEEGEGDAPVVHLLDSLVRRAYHNNVSDIHIEPFEEHIMVRMRMDGMMSDYVSLKKHVHSSLIARIKILSDMDIAKQRIPQDGHFRMRVDGTMVNMRVSVVPTVFGEKAVIRLLAGNGKIDHAETFGMEKEIYEEFKQMLLCPNGIIYLTGPTGSGKTTTLYMILKELAKGSVNIATIEDPVERTIDGISQSQVNVLSGMTFETGLRAILRQDPDIIMVGETRDSETASISVRAAITGHLVFSTLHTNDALSAIVRLEDMGIEPYLIANALTGVVAQRLVRKLCPECAKEVEADQEIRAYLGIPVRTVRIPCGCPCCGGTGYSGRIAIHEIAYIDRTLRNMIAERANMSDVRRYAKEQLHMKTIREQGARLVAEGITSMEELRRAAYYEA
ncbi:MAG: GspE/PulE family protein [Brotaphodocola sp.]